MFVQIRYVCVFAITAFLLSQSQSQAQPRIGGAIGQIGGGIGQLNPLNPNSTAGKKIDSAMGGRFTVTLRNTTRNYINYTFNGQKQIVLLPGYQRTHTGVGNAEVLFDVGAGDGSIRSYNLGSGRTYHFRYRQEPAIDWRAGGSFLDLFRD